jgi:hypothetical protein
MVIVLLGCGHWFREGRPEGMAPGVDGELRVCGQFDHYPRDYPARYLPETSEDSR